MKFSLPKEAFLEELQLLQGIVEKRNTMPILANILMNVSESVEISHWMNDRRLLISLLNSGSSLRIFSILRMLWMTVV